MCGGVATPPEPGGWYLLITKKQFYEYPVHLMAIDAETAEFIMLNGTIVFSCLPTLFQETLPLFGRARDTNDYTQKDC